VDLYTAQSQHLASKALRYDVLDNGSHSFVCHQTRAIPAFTPQLQSTTAVCLVLIVPTYSGMARLS